MVMFSWRLLIKYRRLELAFIKAVGFFLVSFSFINNSSH